MVTEIGDVAKKMTGTPGYIPVELLWEAAEAEPDMDVFSFGVLMLLVFVLPQLATANMFAHSVRIKKTYSGTNCWCCHSVEHACLA